MAKFDYTCSQCKHTDEIDTKYDEVKCSQCGSEDMTKIYVPITAIYKTGGFYSNS